MVAEIYRTDDDGFLPTLQKKRKVINVEGDENKTKHQYICHFGMNNLPINSFQDGLSTGLFHPLGHAIITVLCSSPPSPTVCTLQYRIHVPA